jgi:redox-sensitive bicupin YhaK (pirin superfamily)
MTFSIGQPFDSSGPGKIAMSIHFSRPIGSVAHGSGSTFAVNSFSLHELGGGASPVLLLENVRVMGHPFGPHPHAGFSAVTYVLEDSIGALRSRDSLGNDILMGPGGIVWTQAGSGLLHDELPAQPGRELHALQVFINLTSRHKLLAPQVLQLPRNQMREWHGPRGDRVCVVAGSFADVSSPLIPVEPFDWLDIALRREVSFELGRDRNALIYVREGKVTVQSEGHQQSIEAEQALALHGGGGVVTLQASRPARCLVLSGLRIDEPVLTQGSGFIMNTQEQLDACARRYRAGEMGHLAALSSDMHR